MKIVINLLISLIAFAIAISIAYATGIELVFRAVFLAFAIPVSYTHLTLPTKA